MHGFANNYGWLPEPLEPFAIFNRLSKSPSSNTVETVRCRHFSASAARAASACCTRFSASTPRISRTGTSSLFASCRITFAIFRGSPSARPSRPCNIFRNEPTVATRAASPAHSAWKKEERFQRKSESRAGLGAAFERRGCCGYVGELGAI